MGLFARKFYRVDVGQVPSKMRGFEMILPFHRMFYSPTVETRIISNDFNGRKIILCFSCTSRTAVNPARSNLNFNTTKLPESVGIQESWRAFNSLLPASCLLVARVEMNAQKPDCENDQAIRCDSGIDSWVVCWSILASENRGASNASYAAHADQAGTAKGSFPLPDDIVALVCESRRDISTPTLV